MMDYNFCSTVRSRTVNFDNVKTLNFTSKLSGIKEELNVEFLLDGTLKFTYSNNGSSKSNVVSEEKQVNQVKEEISNLDLDKWRKNYEAEEMKANLEDWKLTIFNANNTKSTKKGYGEYPLNYNEFIDFKNKVIDTYLS